MRKVAITSASSSKPASERRRGVSRFERTNEQSQSRYDMLGGEFSGHRLSEDQISRLTEMRDYKNALVYNGSNTDMMIEIASLLMKANGDFDTAIDQLERAAKGSRDGILWGLPSTESARQEFEDILATSTMKPAGIKLDQICKSCGKNEYYISYKQTRSLDEPFSVFAQCTNCGFSSKHQ